MWFAKIQVMGGKSDDDKQMKLARCPEKSVHDVTSTSRKKETELLPVEPSTGDFISTSDVKSKGQSNDTGQISSSVRKKPLIQLPQKPQIPVNIKRTNPHYTYKTISSIKSSSFPKLIGQNINLFGVVKQILKPISTTSKNKYNMVCMLMDDSVEGDAGFKFHIFSSENATIEEIEEGDILRLHRVRLELYNDEIDGRVFFSHDIVLFKKDDSVQKPITTAKNTLITAEEINRVEALRKWYDDCFMNPTSLSNIRVSGKYSIFCKVVLREPKEEENRVKITVTDGSDTKSLFPSLPMVRYKNRNNENMYNICTEIIAYNKLNEYAHLKVNDFVYLREVVAVQSGRGLHLKINSDASPEVVVEKSPQVADIECRIEQHLESVNENNVQNDADISEQDKETSVETRLQKSEQKSLPAENIGKQVLYICDNRSCLKQNSTILSTKDDCDSRNTESDPGTKSRKQLFTPNYMTDLSDAATDETSEHNIELTKHSSNKVPNENEDVVNPANTNFNDIVEKVKTKYCTPKRVGHFPSSKDVEGVSRRSSSRKLREGKANDAPVVVLERLSSSVGCNDFVNADATRKRGVNTTGSQEDIDDDAETVVNISCQAAGLTKRTRLESLSTEDDNTRNKDADTSQDLESRGAKVKSWLFHPNNKIPTVQQEAVESDEFPLAVVKQILCLDKDSSEESHLISTGCFRTQGFLLEVVPDPSSNSLDLVSGFCYSGCQKIFLFSTIRWRHEENTTIPLCPECIQQEQEKELQLMFLMELVIMDTTGSHRTVMVLRNQAEQFLNCSVMEYVRDEVVRKSRVQLLTDCTLQNTYRARHTPMLDIGVSYLNSTPTALVLVNSTMKLPRL